VNTWDTKLVNTSRSDYQETYDYVFFSPGATNPNVGLYEGWNFNSGNYLFTTDTK